MNTIEKDLEDAEELLKEAATLRKYIPKPHEWDGFFERLDVHLRGQRAQNLHTVEEDFQHFLSYSGLRGEPLEIIEKMRRAFEAAA